MSICSICGRDNSEGSAFCVVCGSKLPQMQAPQQPDYYGQQQNQAVYQNQTCYQNQQGYYQQTGYQNQNGYYNQGAYFNNVPYTQNTAPIRQPDLNEPMTFKDWFFPLLLLLIPIANVIFLVIWGFFGNEKKSKVAFARAALAAFPIYLIIYYILIMLATMMN